MPTVGLTPLRKPVGLQPSVVMTPTAKARPAGSSAAEVVVSAEEKEQQLLDFCQYMDSTEPDETFASVYTGM